MLKLYLRCGNVSNIFDISVMPLTELDVIGEQPDIDQTSLAASRSINWKSGLGSSGGQAIFWRDRQ